jgi:nucleoside-diphosphate-sugar epimerase
MLIPEIVTALQEGRPALCTHGRQRRDFIHVSDAGAAFAAMLDSEVSGAVNVGTGTATAIADVATRLGHLLGHPEPVKLDARAARPASHNASSPTSVSSRRGRFRQDRA